jgi:hypothetical protein
MVSWSVCNAPKGFSYQSQTSRYPHFTKRTIAAPVVCGRSKANRSPRLRRDWMCDFASGAQGSRTLQAADKSPIAALMQKEQTLAYLKYASVLLFSFALHSNLFQQPARLRVSIKKSPPRNEPARIRAKRDFGLAKKFWRFSGTFFKRFLSRRRQLPFQKKTPADQKVRRGFDSVVSARPVASRCLRPCRHDCS